VGLGYHLLGMIPSYQHICPPDLVSTNSTFGLSFSYCGIPSLDTIGSSMEFIKRDGVFSYLISEPIE
jgi:hypothetical protein